MRRSDPLGSRRRRSLALGWALGLLAALFYVLTMVKFEQQLAAFEGRAAVDLASRAPAPEAGPPVPAGRTPVPSGGSGPGR